MESARAAEWNGYTRPNVVFSETPIRMPNDHAFVYPRRSALLGRLAEAVANATLPKRARRLALKWLPYPALESDIVDVVYLNWLVDVARISHQVPPGVEVWEHNGRTV